MAKTSQGKAFVSAFRGLARRAGRHVEKHKNDIPHDVIVDTALSQACLGCGTALVTIVAFAALLHLQGHRLTAGMFRAEGRRLTRGARKVALFVGKPRRALARRFGANRTRAVTPRV